LAMPTAGSLFSLFFRAGAPSSFDEVQESDADRFTQLFHHLLGDGVYLAPSAFEAGFLSTAHDDAVMDKALAAFDAALASL